jgi:hypothetical protein
MELTLSFEVLRLLGECIWENTSIFSQTRCKITYGAIYWIFLKIYLNVKRVLEIEL